MRLLAKVFLKLLTPKDVLTKMHERFLRPLRQWTYYEQLIFETPLDGDFSNKEKV